MRYVFIHPPGLCGVCQTLHLHALGHFVGADLFNYPVGG